LHTKAGFADAQDSLTKLDVIKPTCDNCGKLIALLSDSLYSERTLAQRNDHEQLCVCKRCLNKTYCCHQCRDADKPHFCHISSLAQYDEFLQRSLGQPLLDDAHNPWKEHKHKRNFEVIPPAHASRFHHNQEEVQKLITETANASDITKRILTKCDLYVAPTEAKEEVEASAAGGKAEVEEEAADSGAGGKAEVEEEAADSGAGGKAEVDEAEEEKEEEQLDILGGESTADVSQTTMQPATGVADTERIVIDDDDPAKHDASMEQ
jgi:hypothetical protein